MARPLSSIVGALLLLVAPVCALAGTWSEDLTLEHDGLLRRFRVYQPDFAPPGGHPLLFVLHGGGGDMHGAMNSGTNAEWPQIADEEGLLLIVPNGVNRETGDPAGTDQAWNDCRSDVSIADTHADDVGFISALIDWAAAIYPIDPGRVYVTGASNGGMMSYRLAFELGERIAAMAAFIANLPAVSECRGPDRAIPVLISNGDGETNWMPWAGGCVNANNGCRRGRVLSAEATRDFWIRHNGAHLAVDDHLDFADLDPTDGATASRDGHRDGYEAAEVAFYRIHGGGHVAPTIDHPRSRLLLALLGLGHQCEDIEGSREAWAFLSRHRLTETATGVAPGRSGLLRVEASGSELLLRWAGDCSSDASYALYRGDLRAGYDSLLPEPGMCSIPATQATVPRGSSPADFFLVVPHDGATEGSYGRDSRGASRSPSPSACLPSGPPAVCAGY